MRIKNNDYITGSLIHINAEGRYIFTCGMRFKYLLDISLNTYTYLNTIYMGNNNNNSYSLICGDIYGSRYILQYDGLYTFNRTNVYDSFV